MLGVEVATEVGVALSVGSAVVLGNRVAVLVDVPVALALMV